MIFAKEYMQVILNEQSRVMFDYIRASKSWDATENIVLNKLEQKHGRKFTIKDKEAVEILDKEYIFFRKCWSIGESVKMEQK